jgi:MFS transporter, FSR family, fosmidomycin resistance protein
VTGTTHRRAAAPVPEQEGPLAPWQLAASSALTTALMSVVGATAPDLRPALGVGTAALTLAFIAQMSGALAGAWTTGRVRHRLLEVSPVALLAAAAAACAGYAPTLGFLIAAMLVAGFGSMIANASAQAETMRRAGPRRAQALSRYHVWGGAGAAVFPLSVAVALALGAPYQSAFLFVVVGYVAYAWVNRDLRVVPSPREPRGQPPRVSARARWAVVVAVFGGGLQLTFPLYLASLVVDHFGVSAATGSATIGVYALGVLLARAGGTALLPRLAVDRELRLSCASLVCGYALLAVAGSVPAVMVAALFIGLGVGQLLPLGMARSAREIGDDRYATGLVFAYNSACQLGIPGAVALLLHFTDLRTALVFTVPLAFLIAVGVWRSRAAA